MFKTQTYILVTLAAIISAAWGALFYQHWQVTQTPMSQMWMPPSDTHAWSALDFGIVFIMWSVMMAAMMLPSATPTIIAFSRICQQRKQVPYTLSLIFMSGYLSIWFLFSATLTLLQWQMHGLLWLSPMMTNTNRALAIAIFILAVGYQLLPLKNACLKYCQSPVGFLLNHWQDRAAGAFKMGLRHGITCLGCCWAEMLLMFAVGIMNLTGMILITLLIAMEKFSPLPPHRSSQISALFFLSWAAYLYIMPMLS